MEISANVSQMASTKIEFDNIPNIKTGDWVGVSIATDNNNLRYSAYCDTDNKVTVVLNYVPSPNGQGQTSLSNAPIAFKY